MGGVVSRSCPNCGAPVSTQHTLLTCEFCKAPLMVVKPAPPQASGAPVPVAPFGGVRGPAPHRAGAPAVVVMALAVAIVGTIGAAMIFAFRPGPAAPMPMPMPMPMPVTSTAPGSPGSPATEDPLTVGLGGAGVSGDGLLAMFETQCAQGDAQSCLTAGTLYEHGQMGITVNRAKARSYYERACRLGNTAGCSMVKRM